MADNPDHDLIIHEAAHGSALRDIAQSHDLTEAEVREIIDQEAALAFSGEQLRREWLLEARRLRELGQKYFSRAMSEDDINSAAIYIKSSERLATLTGMNAPVGHAVTVMHATAPQVQETTTRELIRVLDTVCHISPRERELIDRYQYDGDHSPAVVAEINELRAARGKPPVDDPTE